METPKGVDLSAFVNNADRLKGRVDAVLVPDLSHAVMRLSALAGALMLKDLGLETIVSFSCRDRNRLAMQGDLLAAHVLGLPNVMATEGEALELGDQPGAKAVQDLSPAEFLAAAKGLCDGRDMGGRELQGPPSFVLGAAIGPWTDAASAASRAAEARQAVEMGASFLIAPPVFSLPDFAAFAQELGDSGAMLMGSVLLLKSVGMARYLNENMPGVNVDEDTIRRLRGASDRPAEAVKIAAETVQGLKEYCNGALLVTAGWEDRLPDILELATR
ncbi:MAG: methylenetetrahydrofolate reductase [Desulfarculaceae bacterium]|nr:methylenetetrahydrofolate reductase [Desulfarculaceae bacterium]MCF8071466.1 methylenetetrahydrofolate reductase [Desulfarculaceae bacterium]MCF8103406.1 methylenetetrahydrofolate reductase [Desulfarculaceae bacterium]MCF8118066.1 methylenetetrahydrofolate reductase [Desulfarculaceae bacterium]